MRGRNGRTAAAIALTFLVVGPFLPWKISGDLVPYRTPGVRIWPRLLDNGGLAVLACVVHAAWALKSHAQGRKSALRSLGALALLILALLVVQLADVFRRGPQFNSELGAPIPEVGLYVALTSALVLIGAAFIKERRVSA